MPNLLHAYLVQIIEAKCYRAKANIATKFHPYNDKVLLMTCGLYNIWKFLSTGHFLNKRLSEKNNRVLFPGHLRVNETHFLLDIFEY